MNSIDTIQRQPGLGRLLASSALVLAAVVGACSQQPDGAMPGKEDLDTKATGRPESPAAEVHLATAIERAVSETAWVSGRVAPRRRVSPGTKILGRIEEIDAEEGEHVRRGALLARLESRDLDAAVAQAEAGVAMAKARRAQATAQEKRMRTLRARGSATEKDFEDATLALALADAGIRAAEADLAAAEDPP